MSNFGISIDAFIPVRKEPSEQSEMVSQVVFGEHFEILESQKGWSHICIAYDNYTGWINSKQIHPISKDSFDSLNSNSDSGIAETNIQVTDQDENIEFLLPAGSILHGYKKDSNEFKVALKNFRIIDGSVSTQKNIERIKEIAIKFIYTPYLWGGRTPYGIDCSGLTQLVYKIVGISLPRDASQQVKIGETINFLEDTKNGDLAFFDNEEGEITHVGIILEDKMIIHASGRVRIDKIDHQGIFNLENKVYSHKLRIIKRFNI